MLGHPEQMNGCLPELCSFCTILAMQGIEPEAFHTPCALPALNLFCLCMFMCVLRGGVRMCMETRDEHRVSSILHFFFSETVSLKDSGTSCIDWLPTKPQGSYCSLCSPLYPSPQDWYYRCMLPCPAFKSI